jgi:predicted NAD/FAD-binding protein
MKIAVIGSGGAGLTAAWLLEQEHDVVVYERNPTMGGHAHTVEVERDGHMHTVDDGFCWFSESMYPRYLALLKTLGVGTDTVDMTASFTDVQRGKSVFMPPVGFGPVMGVVFSPFALGNLLRFAGAVKAAEAIVRDHVTDITCEAFLAGLSQSKRFQDEFLLPFMSAVWGCPWEQTLRSSIYPLMKYIVLHRPTAFSYYTWQVIHGGTAAYIRSLATHLEHAVVYPDTPVQSVQKTDTGFRVTPAGQEPRDFDQVVVAAGARDAGKILADTQGIEAAKAALGKFEYYQAHVATHCDATYMPPKRSHWAVGNVRYEGKSADMTIWHGHRTGSPVFASYIQDKEPAETKHVSSFWLPMETPQHFEAQKALAAVQGEAGLWFAGDYTRDIGSHEDAVCSAIAVAEKLAPDCARLAQITGPQDGS